MYELSPRGVSPIEGKALRRHMEHTVFEDTAPCSGEGCRSTHGRKCGRHVEVGQRTSVESIVGDEFGRRPQLYGGQMGALLESGCGYESQCLRHDHLLYPTAEEGGTAQRRQCRGQHETGHMALLEGIVAHGGDGGGQRVVARLAHGEPHETRGSLVEEHSIDAGIVVVGSTDPNGSQRRAAR